MPPRIAAYYPCVLLVSADRQSGHPLTATLPGAGRCSDQARSVANGRVGGVAGTATVVTVVVKTVVRSRVAARLRRLVISECPQRPRTTVSYEAERLPAGDDAGSRGPPHIQTRMAEGHHAAQPARGPGPLACVRRRRLRLETSGPFTSRLGGGLLAVILGPLAKRRRIRRETPNVRVRHQPTRTRWSAPPPGGPGRPGPRLGSHRSAVPGGSGRSSG
jgi:hypothetical protein